MVRCVARVDKCTVEIWIGVFVNCGGNLMRAGELVQRMASALVHQHIALLVTVDNEYNSQLLRQVFSAAIFQVGG